MGYLTRHRLSVVPSRVRNDPPSQQRLPRLLTFAATERSSLETRSRASALEGGKFGLNRTPIAGTKGSLLILWRKIFDVAEN